jgi:membrane protein
VRAFLRYSERRGAMLADSVTYRALFSIFAAVLLGFSIAALCARRQHGGVGGSSTPSTVPSRDSSARVGSSTRTPSPHPQGCRSRAIAAIDLVGAAIGAIGSLRSAIRVVCDRTADDVPFWLVMLRNLALAIGAWRAAGVGGRDDARHRGARDRRGWFGASEHDPAIAWGGRLLAIGVTFVLDAVAIAVLSACFGVRTRALWTGAFLGAVGLTVLQQLSGLFVGGAKSNPSLPPSLR